MSETREATFERLLDEYVRAIHAVRGEEDRPRYDVPPNDHRSLLTRALGSLAALRSHCAEDRADANRWRVFRDWFQVHYDRERSLSGAVDAMLALAQESMTAKHTPL